MTQQLDFNLPGFGDEIERRPPPPQSEVQMVWDGAHPVVVNRVVSKWLREERALDPDRVSQLDLARVLHADSVLPPWAGFSATEHRGARSWFEAGYLMVVPLYDVKGALRSLVARLPRKPKDKHEKKSFAALGFGRKGLCFVSGFEQMLLQQLATTSMPQDLSRRWVALEGEMNWMTWACQSEGRSVAEMDAFIGMFGGGFDASWAQVIARSRRPVYLRLDPDGGGDKIANDVGKKLWSVGHRDLWRCRSHEVDDNELHRSGVLHPDPTAGAVVFIPVDREGVPLSQEVGLAPAPAPTRSALPTPTTPATTTKTTKPTSAPRRLGRDERETRLRRGYVEGAIRKGCAKVLAAGAGNHNNALFEQAANCARFMHTQYLDVGYFRDAFSRAGKAVGQSAAEIRTTLLSAWEAARVDPGRIDWPELKELEVQAAAQAGEGEGGPTWADLGISDDGEVWDEEGEIDWENAVAGAVPAQESGASVESLDDSDAAELALRTSFDVDELERFEQSAQMATLLATPRASVEVTAEIAAMADLAAESLASNRPDIYVRDNKLVRVICDGERNPIIELLPLDALIDASSAATFWFKSKANKSGDLCEYQVHPPLQAMRSLMVRATHHEAMPRLEAVMQHATLAKSGEILASPGFHREHGVLVFPRTPGENIGLDDSQCTVRAAQKSLASLLDLFQDFNFENTGHRAAAISLLLTLLVRQNLDVVPFYAVDASTPGTGKGTVYQVIQAIATGNTSLEPLVPLKDENEENKRLLSMGIEGRTGLCLLDNAKSGRAIGNQALDAYLTSGKVNGRILSKSTTFRGWLRVVFAATGNNISLSGDLQRRTLFIRLIAGAVSSDKREWTYPQIHLYAREHRLKYMRDALLIMRAYKLHGKTPITKDIAMSLKDGKAVWGDDGDWMTSKAGARMSSYEEWCEWCRDPLIWLGMDDPVAGTRSTASTADIATSNFQEFLRATARLLKTQTDKTVTVFKLQQLFEATLRAENEIDADFAASVSALGFTDGPRWKSYKAQTILSTYQDRVLEGGLRLVATTPHRRWEIRQS